MLTAVLFAFAGLTQLVECDLPKVEVASSSLVSRFFPEWGQALLFTLSNRPEPISRDGDECANPVTGVRKTGAGFVFFGCALTEMVVTHAL